MNRSTRIGPHTERCSTCNGTGYVGQSTAGDDFMERARRYGPAVEHIAWEVVHNSNRDMRDQRLLLEFLVGEPPIACEGALSRARDRLLKWLAAQQPGGVIQQEIADDLCLVLAETRRLGRE